MAKKYSLLGRHILILRIIFFIGIGTIFLSAVLLFSLLRKILNSPGQRRAGQASVNIIVVTFSDPTTNTKIF